ncbi:MULTISPECIES: F0F1 ATP synthase subunit epsilon [Micrococcaceae]|uniref:F0F1 ATP synthase subunit epsilon n=1 Tax=Micrococcaceae TaxID=1268 RepID=UPI000255E004|nr:MULTISPECIES: F0F1 ATP synthase subunit epsilon [Micrococcaceae]MBB5748373.1 F-type H+-transporting ATPase subunit epsilon [Micrococcus sp. TA1]HRO29530.1 F0F1 ATP synthase subunit epsilon [Citricoccus sp.]HRO93516.1 F0F1 ATP synthase subunit epsilon [Citricoccus sp.]
MADRHELEVEIVAEDHFVWSGPAQSVSARTIDGEIGILPGHTPMLAVLGDGDVVVQQAGGQTITAHAEGGFFSVDNDRVVIVAGAASLNGTAAGQGAA